MTPITTVTPTRNEPSPAEVRLTKAARELESVFLNHLLKNLEKTTRLDGRASNQTPYGSMIVEAMSNAITAGGGIGLADVILESFNRQP